MQRNVKGSKKKTQSWYTLTAPNTAVTRTIPVNRAARRVYAKQLSNGATNYFKPIVMPYRKDSEDAIKKG